MSPFAGIPKLSIQSIQLVYRARAPTVLQALLIRVNLLLEVQHYSKQYTMLAALRAHITANFHTW